MNYDIGVVLITFIGINIISFLLGYGAAEARERRSHKLTRKALRQISERERNLASFVRHNWPDQWKAYYAGHREGYQQGVLQAADLEARAEDPT